MNTTDYRAVLLALCLLAIPACAQQLALPFLKDGLIDSSHHESLCLLPYPHAQTVTIFSPSDSTNHYANGVVMTAFRDTLYCMWQQSQTDEDAPETSVVLSRSADDGRSWSQPEILISATDSAYCTSGGWIATADTLVALINVWPRRLSPVGGYTYYIISTDGRHWSQPEPVTMADGSPMNGIIEQDPLRLPSGRIVGAAHFQPGLHVCPIYTDSPTGTRGWQRADFVYHDRGKQSQELEPSQYRLPDGRLVMVFRDQNSSYRKLAAMSSDEGEHWTEALPTNIPDARVKQSAGNLPDGTAFLAGNPTGSKRRVPLALLLSSDGICFDCGYLLRTATDLPPQRYPGRYKTLGYSYPKSMTFKNHLYVAYSTNKECVECTILDLNQRKRLQ